MRAVADVGPSGGRCDPGGETFELAAADVGKEPPLLRGCRRAVKIARNAMRLPNRSRRLAREPDGVVERGTPQRDERQHVERAHPRMHAGMPAQVDTPRGNPGQSNRCAQNLRPRTDRGDNAAVVRAIAGEVDDSRAARSDCGGTLIDDLDIAAFRYVGDVL